MSIILNHTPSIQDTMGLPRMYTQPVGDVLGPLPWSSTAPHSRCTGVLLGAECAPLGGALPWGSFRSVYLVNKALRVFPWRVHRLLETDCDRHHLAVQDHTVGVWKLCWRQSVHPEWCISMWVILSCTTSVEGATGFPRMCTKPVGDVGLATPWSCTPLYSGSTKAPLAAECSPPNGALPWGSSES